MEGQTQIVIMGAAIVDVLVRPAGPQVFETGSYPAERIRMSVGGDALNEALVLSHLGKRVELRTVLGEDMAGDMLEALCRRQGIRLPATCRRPDLSTGVNVVLVQENGERSFLTDQSGSLRNLREEDVALPYPAGAGILCFASIFVSPRIGGPELERIFRAAKEQGLTVCADMTRCKNGETLAELAGALSYVDYLFPNEEEALLLTGETQAPEAALALHRAGVRYVVIKCGSRGCYLCDDLLREWVPAVPDVACVDTTGAGDSFAAGFLYGLSEGWEIRRCADYANQCGAKAVAELGATGWCEKETGAAEKIESGSAAKYR